MLRVTRRSGKGGGVLGRLSIDGGGDLGTGGEVLGEGETCVVLSKVTFGETLVTGGTGTVASLGFFSL